MGVWAKNVSTGQLFKLIVAVNEPRTLKVIVPADLPTNAPFILIIHTQSSTRGSSKLLKETREMQSNFALHVL